ncbi:MAG: polymer-forming cytoskeletal protein [Kiloniellales bacterium]|nr:polymer-forming cytoskeletal protein [Kiloniellales bacterium]
MGKEAAGRKGVGPKSNGQKGKGRINGGGLNGGGPVDGQTMPSIIGPDVIVVGDLQSQGPVQIEGRIEGDVDSPAVVVGKDAYIDGSVSADQVRILGAVAGWVRAAKVSIAETGRVDGCIQHRELVSERPGGWRALGRLIPASLTDRQRWLLVRNLSLAIVFLLLVYFLGHSGRWSFVQDLPAVLAPVLGDQNVVAFLAFGFLVLLGYAGARAQLAADGSLRRRLVDLERKLAQLRRSGAPRSAGPAKAAESAALAELTERLTAMERRFAGLAGEGPAATLGLPAKSAGRPRHRQTSQRGAGS